MQAQWTPAHLRTEAFTFWQGWYPKNITFDHSYPRKGNELLDKSGNSSRGAIAVTESWLQMLTPPTPVGGPGFFDWEPSTIESILNAVNLFDLSPTDGSLDPSNWDTSALGRKYDLLASIIESVFVDGLSCYNIDKMYQTQGDPSQWTLAGYERKDNFETQLLRDQDPLEKPFQDDDNTIKIFFSISGLSYWNTLV